MLISSIREATTSYNNAIALDPQFKEACFNRGVSLYQLGEYVAATTSYNNAIALDPQFKEAYFNKGRALNKLGKYEEATTHTITL